MSERRLQLQTPEEVPLTFELAAVGSRALAFVIDFFIIAASVALLVILAVEVVLDNLFASDDETAELIAAFVQLAVFLIWNFYFIVTELRWQGRTIGKRVAGIRVIARDGGPLSADLVFARNLTRDLETLIPMMAIFEPEILGIDEPALLALCWLWLGLLLFMPLMNRYHARLGDLVAGTLVVNGPSEALLPDLVERTTQGPSLEAEAPTLSEDPDYRFLPAQLDTYGIRELQILEDVLRRYPDQIEPELLRTIADKIRAKIDWTPIAGRPFEAHAFLRAFYAAQRARLEHKLLFGQRQEMKVR